MGFILSPQQALGPAGRNPYSRRGQQAYGFDPKFLNNAISNLKSNSYTAGRGLTNQLATRLPGRSAEGLNAFRRGAELQTSSFRQGLLPLLQASQQFGEGQRTADIGFGLQRSAQEQDLFKFLRTLAERKRQFDKSQTSFALDTPFGGISF